MVPVITAINADYLPGLRALYNSFKQNAGPGFEFWCVVFGSDQGVWKLAAEVTRLGITNVIMNPPVAAFPSVSSKWTLGTGPEMWYRLQIPREFKQHERAVWLDADCLIVKPLTELLTVDFEGYPVASTRGYLANGPASTNAHQVVGALLAHEKDGPVLAAGVLLFNIPLWNELCVHENCHEVSQTRLVDFKFVVQSVLNLTLCGRFKELDYRWQTFASRAATKSLYERGEVNILHYIGWNPWDVENMNKGAASRRKWGRAIWLEYERQEAEG